MSLLLLALSRWQPGIELEQELAAVLADALSEDGLGKEFEQDCGPLPASFDDVAICSLVEPVENPSPHLNHDVLQHVPFSVVLRLEVNLRLHLLNSGP